MPIEAINFRNDYQSGDTQPLLFECLNGGMIERWVLKLMGRADAELAADWIGSLLAHQLGLPCPEVQIALVSPEALETVPDSLRNAVQAGPAFASKEVAAASSVAATKDLLEILDAEMVSSLYALDLWLEVLDRCRPDDSWNLLRRAPIGLAVIDFGKGLSSCLVTTLGQQSCNLVVQYPKVITTQLSGRAIADTCGNIRAISLEHLS